MLPVPNLDDRTFEQLVREARNLIPRIAPQWTDENAHDPGITLLEMLAWHLEMQQYELDSLSIKHESKYLKLLGGRPRDRMAATTSVSFSDATWITHIPVGTQLKVGQFFFETVRSIHIIPTPHQSITLHGRDDIEHILHDMSTGRTVIYPFGEEGELNATMQIKLAAPLPRNTPVSLWIELDRQNPTHRIPPRYENFIPSAEVQWSYYESEQEQWLPIELERDESYSFHQSGPILFQIPFGSTKVTMIRAEMIRGSYDDAPRIKRMVWNEVFASQGQTWAIEQTFKGWDEQDLLHGQLEPIYIHLFHALYLQGNIQIQYFIQGSWIDISSNDFEIGYSDTELIITLLPNVHTPIGADSIRIIALHPQFVDQQYAGRGTGISFQQVPLPMSSIYLDQIKLQIGSYSEKLGMFVWEDWERVIDFDDSNADCKHYVIDEKEQYIQFSDGIYGVSPPAAKADNIRFISYRTGVGSAGNVKENTIHELAVRNDTLKLTNLFPAYGGDEPETIEEALERMKLEVLEPQCGITSADIERRVHEIAGIRVARVKAIAGYRIGMTGYPEEIAMGHISIVVVPKSAKQFPVPSEGLKLTVAKHLEPYRLLTSQFHIIAPEYVKVTIRAIIHVAPQYEGKEQEVVQVLRRWLNPAGSKHAEGWEFGKAIYKSDVYDMIHTVAGVQYIQDLWLMAEGNNVYQDEGGDIIIPPNGLAFSGDHDIEFVLEYR